MDLLEHQGKALFASAGLPVLPADVAVTPEDAARLAAVVGLPAAVKAQARTGGRGKAGGIRICRTAGEVEAAAKDILAMTIRGNPVVAVLVEQAVEVDREMYLAIVSSRALRGPLLVFAREGGVDIEELAKRDPGAIVRSPIDPLLGICDYQVRDVVAAAALDPEGPGAADAHKALGTVVRTLWRLYRDRDATLVEVNPLVLTASGEVVCLDSKVTVDDNALFRQPDLTPDEPADEREAKARRAGLAFVPLDGDIGVVGNGAGLVMSTIDQIAAAGGRAADFCDIGGGARADVVVAALDAIFAGPPVAAVLVSIFGGITRCDEVARGLIEALGSKPVDAPVVVRLDGSAAEEGRAVLAEARLDGVTVAASAGEAVGLAVAAARRRVSAGPQAQPLEGASGGED
jgi:succinyl-CoA synthetase beta subunit